MSLTPTLRDRLRNGPLEIDEADAVAYAETIIDAHLSAGEGVWMSEPARRELNMVRAFMKLKFPILCCGQAKIADNLDHRCDGCEMRAWDVPT